MELGVSKGDNGMVKYPFGSFQGLKRMKLWQTTKSLKHGGLSWKTLKYEEIGFRIDIRTSFL